MTRTKSLLFDDDVYYAFIRGRLNTLATIDEAIAMWQQGIVNASVTRRFISQHLAAMTVIKKRDGGVTPEQLVKYVKTLADKYPALYQEDQTPH